MDFYDHFYAVFASFSSSSKARRKVAISEKIIHKYPLLTISSGSWQNEEDLPEERG